MGPAALEWLMTQADAEKLTVERFQALPRELGTLLIAFAPLDAVLSESENRWYALLFFLGLGLTFFIASLIWERRRMHVA